jgi:SAM-dependent methyltransferase
MAQARLKSVIRGIVPLKYRLWRYTLYEKLKYVPSVVYNLGEGVECPFCGWHFRRFLPAGFHYPVLIEKRVIGAGPLLNAICPRCKSNARERLIYLYIRERTTLLSDHARLLHVAPEPQLQKVFAGTPSLHYFTSDLAAPNTMFRMDLMQLPHTDDLFDVVVCSHVLEHVADDLKGMRELCRVLKPGGWAILQVPIALALDHTYENLAITDEEGRIREFGQRDHVRLYAMDYLDRLKTAGFSVRTFTTAKEFGEAFCWKYGLDQTEDLYICSKPARGGVPGV